MRLFKARKTFLNLQQHVAPLSAILQGWYRLTTPPPVADDAHFKQREIARQAHLTSTILLIAVFVLPLVLLGNIFERNGAVCLVVFFALLVQGGALWLNRQGRVLLAGLCIISWFVIGLYISLLIVPGGKLSVINLPTFYVLIEPELLAVSLLPTWSVFLVALLDSIFIWSDLVLHPRTLELDRLLTTSSSMVIFQPIILQIVVAVISYLWVHNMLQAAARADRAEEIVHLTQTIAEQNRQRLEASHAERQIILAFEHQQKLNQLKDRFLVNVSHELRTPLTTVEGYLALLKEFPDSLDAPTQAQFVARAMQGCEELTYLVNNILKAMTITEEVLPIHAEIIQVNQLIQDVIEHLDPREALSYEISLQAEEGIQVWADQQYLRQVLRNLLSNALKYASKGTAIRVHVSQRDLISPVSICVQDAGPGIPPEELPLLFEKFVRLKRDLAGTTPGTGLGLYISKQLVEAMGGAIWAESSGRKGEGCRFCITLPPSFSHPRTIQEKKN